MNVEEMSKIYKKYSLETFQYYCVGSTRNMNIMVLNWNVNLSLYTMPIRKRLCKF